jgi:hypothetical protein
VGQYAADWFPEDGGVFWTAGSDEVWRIEEFDVIKEIDLDA